MPQYYRIWDGPSPLHRGVADWRVDGGLSYRLDHGAGIAETIDPNQPLDAQLIRWSTSPFDPTGDEFCVLMDVGPGQFFRRVARPSMNLMESRSFGLSGDSSDSEAMAGFMGQLVWLLRSLESIFQTVHPDTRNKDSFGHGIRNLLILASTEAEAHWRGILYANNYPRAARDLATTDYVKLKAPLRLDEYSVTFPLYPALNPIFPFKGWATAKPSATIPWYAAYNLVKHDRESNFVSAKLEHAITAVAACTVMMAAQMGNELFRTEAISNAVSIADWPTWSISQRYHDARTTSVNLAL